MARPALTTEQVTSFRARAADAALTLLGDGETEDVSLRTLARALGCSHATPYRYFESKEDLFMAVRARAFSRFAGHLRQRLDTVDEPIERIRAVSHAYFEFAQREPACFRVMFQLGQPKPEAYPWSREAPATAWQIVENTVGEAIDADLLVGDVSVVAHLFWSAVHGITSLHLAHRFYLGPPGDALLNPLLDALLRAHAPEPS